MASEDREVKLSEKAWTRLNRARREGESYSDVVLRLSLATVEGLQRRGEQEVVTSDGRRLMLGIDQDKCLGAMSCVTMAPSVFAYDDTSKGLWRKRNEPLGMQEVEEGQVATETLRLAAESCPYRAIRIRDAGTGDEVYG